MRGYSCATNNLYLNTSTARKFRAKDTKKFWWSYTESNRVSSALQKLSATHRLAPNNILKVVTQGKPRKAKREGDKKELLR